MTEAVAVSLPAERSRTRSWVAGTYTARRAARSGLLWGYIFGVSVAGSAISYTTIYKTQAERMRLAHSFVSDKATAALFGPATRIQTVAGFTVYKTSMTLMLLGAVWGLLTATRLLRGEEDAGRWELLLSAPTTKRSATTQALLGLLAGAATLWAITALFTSLSGLSSKVDMSPRSACYLALAYTCTPVMFLAVGALTSQLAATRRQAATYAAWILGLSYALRMLADAGIGLHALVWTSPLGWVEELQPLTSPRPLALLPVLGFSVAVAGAAVVLCERRDVGEGVLVHDDGGRPSLRLLSGALGLSARLLMKSITAWLVAIAATGFLMGLVAKAAGSSISGSSVEKVFSRFGAPGTGADTYLGVAFVIVAVLVSFVGAGQVGAARSEEAEGRLEHLLARPLSRTSWLGGRLLVVASCLVGCGLVAGLFTWLGAATQRSGTGLAVALKAGINVVPAAALVTGLGILAIGVWPRGASAVAYGVLVWSLVVSMVGGFGALDHWLLDTSVFHQMASAPAVAPNWESNGVMAGIGALAACAGLLAFARRDLQGE